MPTFTYSDLNSNQGTATGEGLRDVANTAANFACDLYQNYAAFSTGFPDPTGLGAYLNGVYSSLCKPRSKVPQPPTTPFSGGQCPIDYSATAHVKTVATEFDAFLPLIRGPVQGVVIGPFPSPPYTYMVGLKGQPIPTFPLGLYPFTAAQNQNDLLPATVTNLVLTPRSGPDNCGNPAPTYPPTTPPLTQIQNNTTVNIGAGASITVPIAIIPVINNANISLNPQFTVKVGPFNVTFDAGGVTIAPNFTIGNDTTTPPPTQTPPGTTNPPQPALPPSSGGCDLSPVITRLTTLDTKIGVLDITTKATQVCACPGNYTLVPSSIGNGNNGVAALPAYTRDVQFDVGALAQNVRSQYGGGTAPDVEYVGWYSFSDAAGRGGDRNQLSYKLNTVSAPAWAKVVSWTLQGEMVASVKAIAAVPTDSNYEPGALQFKKKPA